MQTITVGRRMETKLGANIRFLPHENPMSDLLQLHVPGGIQEAQIICNNTSHRVMKRARDFKDREKL
jgi:hypothetical protein